MPTNAAQTSYRGRFAPSPTGPLHFGSLLTALASFLDARANQGQWLVRIDDIDPPREQAGAKAQILATLEHYQLHWDESVCYQSAHLDYYRQLADSLQQQHKAYACACSRKSLNAYAGIYPGLCRHRDDVQAPAALRLNCAKAQFSFVDGIQGTQKIDLDAAGDFIIWRKDGLVAYQLACAADDHRQGITHIVRGFDLLESTPRQYYLQSCLDLPHPHYAHIPVILNAHGDKLSKQNRAQALSHDDPRPSLFCALHALGQQPPNDLPESSYADMLSWAISHWQLANVPRQPCISAEHLYDPQLAL